MRRALPPKALTLGQRRSAAAQAIEEAAQHGAAFDPVRAVGPVAAHWGRAWTAHIEREPAWAGQLDRGRPMPRDGLIVDLRVRAGRVEARVQCHRLYATFIELPPLSAEVLAALRAALAGELTTVEALLAGQLSDRAAAVLHAPRGALLPDPADLRQGCTCADPAPCRHLAGVLYAIAARHDREPGLIWALRGVDVAALVAACAPPPGAPAPALQPAPAPPTAPPPRAAAPPRPPLPSHADDDRARALAAVRARVDGLRAAAATRPLSGEEAHMLRVYEPWLRARGG